MNLQLLEREAEEDKKPEPEWQDKKPDYKDAQDAREDSGEEYDLELDSDDESEPEEKKRNLNQNLNLNEKKSNRND